MDNIKRRDLEMPYISDASVMEEQKACRRILQELNFADRSDFEKISRIVKELLGKSENAFINPPFYCDYGSHIEAGKNFFANYNCTIIDVAKVTIGDNCQMAPNVAIYTAGHPLHPVSRNSLYEYGISVTIGDRRQYRHPARGAHRQQHRHRRRQRGDERHPRLGGRSRQSVQSDQKNHGR